MFICFARRFCVPEDDRADSSGAHGGHEDSGLGGRKFAGGGKGLTSDEERHGEPDARERPGTRVLAPTIGAGFLGYTGSYRDHGAPMRPSGCPTPALS